MRKKLKQLLTMLLCIAILAGCGEVRMDTKRDVMSVADARVELDALMSKIKTSRVEKPRMDIYSDNIGESAALADIDTFDMVVTGTGSIDVEIAAATELTSEAPDDWITIVAKSFNREKFTIDGEVVSVSVRQITSGEITTYVNANAYQPNAAVFSNEIWGKMIEVSGIGITKICDRIAGNTAGILISKEAEAKVLEAYGSVDFTTVVQASKDGVIVLGYPNPYTSSTGINGLTKMLEIFDPDNPLSDKANSALLEYQKTAPPVAYTTSVLRNQAKKGIIDAMLMEEQAYINTPELSNYTSIPLGVRHDHPVYTFEWNSNAENQVIDLFIEYCLTEQNQKLATEKGFNRHNEYKSQDTGLSGQGYLTAQSMWKQNKNGGHPVVAVFVCDISGSMRGTPIASLQESLTETLPYIGSEHYVGLVSYSDTPTINVSFFDYAKKENEDDEDVIIGIHQFDEKQRSYFSGEANALRAVGGTNTYDAVLVALDMINKAQEMVPDAVPLIILLTDGDANGGYSLSRILPIVEGMRVPVYSIAYNYGSNSDLTTLSDANEASVIKADSEGVVNQLRNLFTTQL